MIGFVIPLAPVAKGRPRFFRGVAVTPAQTRRFEREAALWMRKVWKDPPLEGPLKVTARFILRCPKRPKWGSPAVKPDVDNFLKSLDFLNGVLWKDDAQITDLRGIKLYALDGTTPRIEIEVSRSDDALERAVGEIRSGCREGVERI